MKYLNLLIFIFSSPTVMASSGEIGPFVSTDRDAVIVRYATLSGGDTLQKARLGISLTTPEGSDCQAAAQAVLVTKCGGDPRGSVQNVDLKPKGVQVSGDCKFMNPEPVVVTYQTHAGFCDQQIAIVVNGRWLKDSLPHGEASNFGFRIGN